MVIIKPVLKLSIQFKKNVSVSESASHYLNILDRLYAKTGDMDHVVSMIHSNHDHQ